MRISAVITLVLVTLDMNESRTLHLRGSCYGIVAVHTSYYHHSSGISDADLRIGSSLTWYRSELDADSIGQLVSPLQYLYSVQTDDIIAADNDITMG